MAEHLPPAVNGFLDRHHVMTLATQGPQGPWAAAVFYVRDGAQLVFVSSPNSRHARDLAIDPRCAATLHDECEDWQDIKGLQLEGRVHALAAEAVVRARERYAERFPVTGPSSLAPAAIREALLRVRWYAFVPQRGVHLDNRRGFGHRETFEGISPP